MCLVYTLFIIKYLYPNLTYKEMIEEQKQVKKIDWKTDTYGDYPFIKSTFRSNRVWTEMQNVN